MLPCVAHLLVYQTSRLSLSNIITSQVQLAFVAFVIDLTFRKCFGIHNKKHDNNFSISYLYMSYVKSAI